MRLYGAYFLVYNYGMSIEQVFIDVFLSVCTSLVPFVVPVMVVFLVVKACKAVVR